MNAQSFREYYPKEGIATALAQAINAGLKTPELFMVATTSEKSASMPALLTPKIDLTTGAATVWLYQFKDKADTSKQSLVGVVKVTLFGNDQFISNEIAVGSLNQAFPSLSKPLPGTNWMNSDTLVKNLAKNSKFTNFKNTHNNTRIQSTIMGINTFNPLFEMDLSYWFSLISGDNVTIPLTCVTSTKTGETTCLEPNEVIEDNTGTQVNIFPNPASNTLTIEIPKTWTNNEMTLSFYNYSGSELLKKEFVNTSEFLHIPLNFLQNGEYIISLNNGIHSMERLFIIKR
jgi:hypothetical protein